MMRYRWLPEDPDAAEGGCGVVGFIASEPVRGIAIRKPCQQMHNRGNGKGGGVAAAGLVGEDIGIPQDLLSTHNLVAIAYLDPNARGEVEEILHGVYDIAATSELKPACTPEEAGLEVTPPALHIYMCEPKAAALKEHLRGPDGNSLGPQSQRDHLVMSTTDKINDTFYASMGEKRAFVLSHGMDMLVAKVVGYAEQAAKYYGLDDVRAKAWIGHQRYPTKGIVWHPGGAHPFVGMHEALVHNGDFANYAATCAYLKQFGVQPRFLTDTEVSVQLLDLYTRRFGYPLEWAIEALAPTTDLDLARLPADKRATYERIQLSHVHGSPDGPWFFIIIRNPPGEGLHLTSIIDTSMLRPQVFAKMEGDGIEVCLVGSERQAVDAALESMHADDPRIRPVADRYWMGRGASHTDGGAFTFRAREGGIDVEDKFGNPVDIQRAEPVGDFAEPGAVLAEGLVDPGKGMQAFLQAVGSWSQEEVQAFLDEASKTEDVEAGIALLTAIHDRPMVTAPHRPAWVSWRVKAALTRLFTDQSQLPAFTVDDVFEARDLDGPVILDVTETTPEGPDCPGLCIEHLYRQGATRVYAHGFRGQRFAGCGLGPGSEGFRIDCYGNVGDYTASGLDGGVLHIHMNGQDQLAQIMKSGELVIHGDVGQAFGYGIKGGQIFIRGSAAGRPLINGVGKPQVVINGSCLDYLAESFMAGDPLHGGGFCIVNGIEYNEAGQLVDLPEPYPGGNLFSLASGGAIYVRDPHQTVIEPQLNGGELVDLTPEDWALIEPLLQRNAEHFGITVERLLTVDGEVRPPAAVYRKVQPMAMKAMARVAHA